MFERTKKIGKMKKNNIHSIQWKQRTYNITVTTGYVTAVSDNILQWCIGVSWATVASWLEKKKAKIIPVEKKERKKLVNARINHSEKQPGQSGIEKKLRNPVSIKKI